MVFEPIEAQAIDATERAIQRVLTQFRQSPVLIEILAAISLEVQDLLDAIKGTIELRGPGDATGVQLDALGRIVGQGRLLGNQLNGLWFVPDSSLLGADYGEAWVEGAEYLTNPEVDDTVYPFLIEGKIARNFTRYGSVPEIQEAITVAFGIDISFVLESPMAVTAIVPDDTPLWIIQLLQSKKDTTRADSVYYMPISATVLISNVVRISDYTP